MVIGAQKMMNLIRNDLRSSVGAGSLIVLMIIMWMSHHWKSLTSQNLWTMDISS